MFRRCRAIFPSFYETSFFRIGFGTADDAVDAVVFVVDVLAELLPDFSRRCEHFFSSARDALLSAVFLSSSSSSTSSTSSATVCVPVLRASVRLIDKLVVKHCSSVGFIAFDSYGVRLDGHSDLDVAFITQQWAIRFVHMKLTLDSSILICCSFIFQLFEFCIAPALSRQKQFALIPVRLRFVGTV